MASRHVIPMLMTRLCKELLSDVVDAHLRVPKNIVTSRKDSIYS
jgi:hypothetical protein